MKRIPGFRRIAIFSALVVQGAAISPPAVNAQGLHFSQFYNAPMLVSPANTGLMSDNDYRAGANYRSQWAAVPVPFRSFSFYGDLQLFRRHNETNWLGLGGAMFTDKAGDGNLSLSRWEAFAAYHIELGEYQMISIGLSAATVERSVDFSRLTFDTQWDGYVFNNTLPNGEQGTLSKTRYLDIGAGLNYAIFPNELVYIKFGASVAHVNQPSESFYTGQVNQIGYRPTGYVDMLARIGERVVINPSIYYTTQKSASEILYGSLVSVLMGSDNKDGSLVLGAYHRWNESLVATFGYDWNGLRVMASYDYTMSQLGRYNNHNGALELGVRWQGSYPDGRARERRAYNCPRF
jgi:type IX secretion system PorP/SprF family membrane protein